MIQRVLVVGVRGDALPHPEMQLLYELPDQALARPLPDGGSVAEQVPRARCRT